MGSTSSVKSEAIKSLIASAMKETTTKKISMPDIDERFEFLKKNYNFGALFKKCNYVRCTKKNPAKQMIINENKRDGRTRELSAIYLCDKHVQDADKLQKKLASMTKGAEIVISVRPRV